MKNVKENSQTQCDKTFANHLWKRLNIYKKKAKTFHQCYKKKACEEILSKPFFNGQKQPEACNFIKKETLAQVFFCEFCEISKNTFFTEHL